MTDSATKLLGLIGDPVEHSLSPALHSFLLSRAGLNYCYLAFRVGREGLGAALAGMRALGIRGFNVTIPHKEAVIPLLDRLSPEAEGIGAVNVVVNEGGVLIGHNTDCKGFLRGLEARGIPLSGMKAVVVGAGGAAAAAVFGLLSAGAEVAVANRTFSRAEALARRFSRLGTVEAAPLEGLPGLLREAELLVNATPLGMWPHTERTPVPPEFLRGDVVVYDLIYNPLKTKLLREAEARGCSVIRGLEMLVHQGVGALELWTGHRFRAEDVAAALEYLEGAMDG